MLIMLLLLGVWLGACAICGYQRNVMRFLAVLFAGLAAHLAWMVFGLSAHPFSYASIMADASMTIFALCAFAAGFYASRLRRVWHETTVDDDAV